MSIRIGDEVWCMPRSEALEVYPYGVLPPDGLEWYQKCVVTTIEGDTIGVDFGVENLAGQELHALNGRLIPIRAGIFQVDTWFIVAQQI